MSFDSLGYILFVAVLYCLYRVCPLRWRAGFLLIASYVFYCTWSPKAAVALACATVFAFFAGKWAGNAESAHRGRLTALFTTAMLAGYLGFWKTVAVTSLPGIGRIALPLGVSYYTFKLISYVMDIYYGKSKPEWRFIAFASYVAFFPQILAGPIQRPDDYLSQMPPARTSLLDGAARIAWGLLKKVIIADQLSPAVNYVFSHMYGLHGTEILVGFYLYPLQLYADFSALTDIAIGTGRLFGIESPENFDDPFTSSTITQFWRRWHMSLTGWLGDYIFTPLRMATRRLGNAGLAFSIAVNTVAIGLWHGFSWGFFIFGAIHALYLTVEALTSRFRARFYKKRPQLDRLGTWIGRFYVFHFAGIAFLFFRASSVRDAMWGLTHLLSGATSPEVGFAQLSDAVNIAPVLIGIAGFLIVVFAEHYRPDLWWRRMGSSLPAWAGNSLRALVLVELLVIVILLVAGSFSDRPFIYEAF